MGGKIDEDGQSHYISHGSAWYAPWQTFCNFLLFLRELASQDAPMCSGASVGGSGVVSSSCLSCLSCPVCPVGLVCLSVCLVVASPGHWLPRAVDARGAPGTAGLPAVAQASLRQEACAKHCGFTRAAVLPCAGLTRAGGVQRTLCHSHPPSCWAQRFRLSAGSGR